MIQQSWHHVLREERASERESESEKARARKRERESESESESESERARASERASEREREREREKERERELATYFREQLLCALPEPRTRCEKKQEHYRREPREPSLEGLIRGCGARRGGHRSKTCSSLASWFDTCRAKAPHLSNVAPHRAAARQRCNVQEQRRDWTRAEHLLAIWRHGLARPPVD